MSDITRRKISKAAFEALEGRRMFAYSGVTDGVLTVVGNSNTANNMAVSTDDAGAQLTVKLNGASKQYSADEVKSIRIIGGEKSDLVNVDPRIDKPCFVRTGAGNDTVTTGRGDDVIYTGNDNDKVTAGSGEDAIYGGNGADILIGNAGNDFISGGAGSDRIDAGSGTDTVYPNGVATPGRITSFQLINADNDEVVRTFAPGEIGTINLQGLPSKHLNFRANVLHNSGGSVKFDVAGANSLQRTENTAPFAMAGDSGGDFINWTPKTGTTMLHGTSYTGKNAAGIEGTTFSMKLRVVDTAETPPSNGGGVSSKPTLAPEPTPDPTPIPTPAPVADNTGEAGAPVSVINFMDQTVNAGQAIHVDALSSTLKAGSVTNTQYAWDFGDVGSRYNRLPGWNAAHAYEKPGSYTVTLKVTNSAGKTSHVSGTVTVAAAGRRFVYVSNDGNDTSSGASPVNAVKSFSRAAQLVGDNVEILFNRGDSWTVTSKITINGKNVVIGSFGTGAKPILKYSGAMNYSSIIRTSSTACDVTVRDITFDSANTTSSKTGYNDGISTAGSNISVRGCTFLNVGYAINANGHPKGTLIQDNDAPNKSGIRSYLAYLQGYDHVVLGNTAYDSIHEHILRVDGSDRVLVHDNHFENPYTSVQKGTLTIHEGSYIYVTGNVLKHGKVTVGPLGEGDGLSHPNDRTNYAVIENNDITSPVIVEHGTNHIALRDNVVHIAGGQAFEIEGYEGTYKRGVVDAMIVHNTVIDTGTKGQFLKMGGTATNVSVMNNVFIAPNLDAGAFSAAGIYNKAGNLASFNEISNNIWPSIEGGSVNAIGGDYKTPVEWNGYSNVINDKFQDLQLDHSNEVSLSGIGTAGADLKLAS